MTKTVPIPEVGQAVWIRNRLAGNSTFIAANFSSEATSSG